MEHKQVCGTCKYNRCVTEGYGSNRHQEFYCSNEQSVNQGSPTWYDDNCMDWEEKDE